MPGRLTATRRLVLLVLALFVHAALGAVVVCVDDATSAGSDVARVASAAPLPGGSSCPDCATDRPGITPGSATAPGADVPFDPCGSHEPCQDGPSRSHADEDSTIRALGDLAIGPAVLAACAAPDRAESPTVAVSPTGPVPPPAVRAPVAVLCVDRN